MKPVTYLEQELTSLWFCIFVLDKGCWKKATEWHSPIHFYLCSKCVSRFCAYLQNPGKAAACLLVVPPIEPYPDFAFSVEAINRTQKIALNSVTHMHSSYEIPQVHGCRPLQDPSCKFILGSWKDLLQHKNRLIVIWPLQKMQCSPQLRILCSALICLTMLANLRDVKIH